MPRKYSKEEKEEYLKRYYESKQSKLNFAKINGISKTIFPHLGHLKLVLFWTKRDRQLIVILKQEI